MNTMSTSLINGGFELEIVLSLQMKNLSVKLLGQEQTKVESRLNF